MTLDSWLRTMKQAPLDSVHKDELVRRAGIGDLSAFDELVEIYRNGIFIVAIQIVRDRERAEDVVQETFLAAYKYLGQLQDLSRFPHWLCAIARHRARRNAKGEQVGVKLPLDHLILEHAPSLQRRQETRETNGFVHDAVRDLPEEFRGIVQLYYLQGWKVGEVSNFLGLPQSTVKWRLNRARKLLREKLSTLVEDEYESVI